MSHRLRTALAAALVLGGVVVASSAAPASAVTPSATEFDVPTAGGRPVEIVAGPDGNLWFTEILGNKIGRITPEGVITEFSAGITAGAAPTGIDAGNDGNVWFTESDGDRIGRISPAGVVTEFSAGITADSTPLDIATGTGLGVNSAMWFTEFDGDRIGRITAAGVVTEFSAGITAGAKPRSIAAGADNNMWFTEPFGDRIGRITTAGVITEFSAGITAGSMPFDIALGPDGNMWFTEFAGDRVGKITPAGVVTEFPVGDGVAPAGIVAGPDGAMWFTERDTSRIGRITLDGTVTHYDTGISAASAPSNITGGPDGQLWFTEIDGNRIGRIGTEQGPPAFANTAPIAVNDVTTATPYPSVVTVSGLEHRRTTDVTVQLTGLDHTFFGDIDALLVGPQGQAIEVVSDVGASSRGQHGLTLRFNDAAPTTLAASVKLASGTYKPTNVAADGFAAPAPAGPYATELSVFDGRNPNGDWSLFVVDDLSGDVGDLYGGWGLDIETEAVPVPSLDTIVPVSPANQNNPVVTGTAEAGSMVSLHDNAACTGAPLAAGTAADFASPGIPVPVPGDATTTIYASITDPLSNVSACSTTHLDYVEDSVEAAPVMGFSIPAGPANDNSPEFVGTAGPGATVNLYADDLCAGPIVASGTTADFANAGLTVPVADFSTTTIRATATDFAGNVSACSASSVTYVEDSTVAPVAPQTTITKAPKKKIVTKKRKVVVTFTFKASQVGSSFACRLDKGTFKPCASPRKVTLRPGRHVFAVRATKGGLTDATPATYVVRVVRKR